MALAHVYVATTLLLSVSTVASAERSLGAHRPVLTAQEAPAPAVTDAIAVAAFANITGAAEDDWIGLGIAETITADLAGNGTLTVVGSDAVAASLRSLEPGSAADPSEAPALRAGRLVGARWIVSGGYQRLGDRLRLTARIVDVATATVRHAITVDGRLAELFALQDELSAGLQRGLPIGDVIAPPPPAPAAPAPVAPPPPPAPAVPTPVAPPPPPAPVAPAPVAPAPVAPGPVTPTPTARAPVAPVPPSPAPSSSAPVVPAPVTPAPSAPGGGSPLPQPGRAGFAAEPGTFIDGPPPPLAPETIVRDAAGRATVRAVPLDAPLQIDGTLDEGPYEIVAPLSNFIQQQPDEGEPATERTESWVFYDDRSIYVSARLWDSAPESRWVANEMQRDSFQIINNDTFSVAFDTFYDRRNGFAFMVNPIGGFFDYQITDEGNPNSDWNPIWDVSTGRFEGGWTVEMEIPFKSIRFEGGESQVWGLQLGRNIRWKNEWTYLTPVAISAGPGMFRLSAAGTLTGLEVPSGNRTFEIKPYAIGSLATDINAVPAVNNDGDGDFGVDVKYGLTENLTADFTYNTDFAQVEVDEQQVNLTRFSLFFPEKREFFLEGRGIFDFGRGVRFGGGGGGPGGGGRPGAGGFFGGGDVPTVFFSRRIGLESGQTVPILGGGRLTGKVGDFTVGALNIQTDDVLGLDAVSTNFTALRVKRDLLRRSAVGAIFTGLSVSLAGDGSNEAYGLDGVFSFYDNVNFNGYYARTRTPGLDGDDESYQAVFTYNGDLYALGVDHLLVGDNFNPEIGFLRRDDFRRTFVQAQFSPRPRRIVAVRQFTWGGSLDYIETVAGLVESRIEKASFETEFENSDRFNADVQHSYEFLNVPFNIARDVTIPVGGYDFQDYYLSYALGAQRRLSGTLSLQRGEFFDGDITAVGYSRGRIEVTPQFSFEPSVSINRVQLPVGNFTAKLATTRLTYTFTPRMFFSGLLQYNSSADALGTNLRLRWEYRPGSELFVVYNDQRDTELAPNRFPMLENRAFVVKFTRLFRY